jgi:hypothetical protein
MEAPLRLKTDRKLPGLLLEHRHGRVTTALVPAPYTAADLPFLKPQEDGTYAAGIGSFESLIRVVAVARQGDAGVIDTTGRVTWLARSKKQVVLREVWPEAASADQVNFVVRATLVEQGERGPWIDIMDGASAPDATLDLHVCTHTLTYRLDGTARVGGKLVVLPTINPSR